MAKRGRKARNWLGVELMDEMKTMGEDGLHEVILKAVDAMNEIEDKKEADETLQNLKLDLKDINKGYSDAMKYQKAKINFAMELLKANK